jgi:hypothetical protein
MFIAETKIGNQWAQLTGVTFSDDTTYIIVNNSPDVIYAVESASTPEGTVTGVPVPAGNYIKYEKGSQNLYFRNGKSLITDATGSTQTSYSRILVNAVDSDSNEGV